MDPAAVAGELIKLVDIGAVALAQVVLPDSNVVARHAREHVAGRWKPDSARRRAAGAALADPEARGVDLRRVHLHGQPVEWDMPIATVVSLRWEQIGKLTERLAVDTVTEWTEVVRPTRTRPLLAVRITPLDRPTLATYPWLSPSRDPD